MNWDRLNKMCVKWHTCHNKLNWSLENIYGIRIQEIIRLLPSLYITILNVNYIFFCVFGSETGTQRGCFSNFINAKQMHIVFITI